jgi:hypothetical protein
MDVTWMNVSVDHPSFVQHGVGPQDIYTKRQDLGHYGRAGLDSPRGCSTRGINTVAPLEQEKSASFCLARGDQRGRWWPIEMPEDGLFASNQLPVAFACLVAEDLERDVLPIGPTRLIDLDVLKQVHAANDFDAGSLTARGEGLVESRCPRFALDCDQLLPSELYEERHGGIEKLLGITIRTERVLKYNSDDCCWGPEPLQERSRLGVDDHRPCPPVRSAHYPVILRRSHSFAHIRPERSCRDDQHVRWKHQPIGGFHRA